jgi:hypothetical protein
MLPRFVDQLGVAHQLELREVAAAIRIGKRRVQPQLRWTGEKTASLNEPSHAVQTKRPSRTLSGISPLANGNDPSGRRYSEIELL